MATVDDRVVQLKFDNKQFESATATSMSTLDKLKKSLDFSPSKAGVADLARSFEPLGVSVDGASAKFVALATVGITALSNITNKAIAAGASITNALTIAPIGAGFHEYELKMQAIQTIMAGSGASLKVVNGYLNELNTYSDKTIYSFSDMTQNIGKFTNAGVQLPVAVKAIQGIANAAALSGANAEEAGRAMYNFSQALSKGFVQLIDWKSIEMANMATVGFKQQLIDSAVAAGTLKKAGDGLYKTLGPKPMVISATKNFNDSLNEQWMTTQVLTKTLGDYANEQTKIGKKAFAAAQDVKTMSMMFDTLKEAAGSGWAQSFEIIFGNLDEAKGLWTGLTNAIGGVIGSVDNVRNHLLQFIKDIGGFKQMADAFLSWIEPIRQAWSDIFPPTVGNQLKTIGYAFLAFFKAITLNTQQITNLRIIFGGFFSVLSIGWSIIKNLFGFLKSLFGIFTSGGSKATGSILSLAASVGLAVTRFKNFLESTNAIPAFFDRLTRAIGPAVYKIGEFVRTVSEAVGGALGKLPTLLQGIGTSATSADQTGLTPLQKTMQGIASVWDWLVAAGQKVLSFFGSIGSQMKSTFDSAAAGSSNLTQTLQNFVNNINWYNMFKVAVGGAAIAVIASVIRAIWSAVTLILVRPAQVFKQISDVLNSVMSVLESYQKSLIAGTILKIAIAIGILALSMKVLSTIERDKLIEAGGALAWLMASLIATFKIMGEAETSIVKAVATMTALAIAINLLVGAIFVLGKMDTEVLSQGLKSVSFMMVALGVAMRILPNAAYLVGVAASLVALGVSIAILSAAIFALGKMDPDVLSQGFEAMAFAMFGIAAAMRIMPVQAEMVGVAASIIAMAVAIRILVPAIQTLGAMDQSALGQGLEGLSFALLALTVALVILGKSPDVLAGAAAMIIVSAALLILAQVIKTLGEMDLKTLVIGIGAIVVALVVIGATAMLLAEAIPFVLGFGVALMALGAGFALFGLGALAFAMAFSVIVGILSLGFPVISGMIDDFLLLLPKLGEAAYQSMVTFAQAFAKAVPELVAALVTLVGALLGGINELLPKILKTVGVILDGLLQFLVDYIPKIADAGLKIINGLLQAISDNLPNIIANGKNVVIKWIAGMGEASKDIITAAGDTLIKFVAGITKWIEDNKDLIHQTTKDLGKAIVDGITAGVTGLFDGPINLIKNLGNGMIAAFKQVLGIHSPSKVFTQLGKDVVAGFVLGLTSGYSSVVSNMKSITDGIREAKNAAAEDVKDLTDKVKELEKKPKTAANKAALAKAKAELATAKADKAKLEAAWATVSKEHKADIVKLQNYAAQYDTFAADLETKKKNLEDAQKTYDDYYKSISDKYSSLPTIEATSSLDDYFNSIRNATQANIKFKATMEQLRKLGLDDNQYKKFMEQGTEIQPFLDQLLRAGGSTITELNNIDTSLIQSANDLGKSGADALYKSGVDLARGLVEGLESQMADLVAKMKTIGKAIADEIRRELGIKSPSKVFAEIGAHTMRGLAKGIDANSNVVELSARRAGKTAIDSMKVTMNGLADAISSDIDVQPTIAPVLDLDQFRKDAGQISGMLGTSALQASVSTRSAVATNSALETTKAAIEALTAQQQAGNVVELTQINNSPKALSSADIYRQTKNQLSVLKGALGN